MQALFAALNPYRNLDFNLRKNMNLKSARWIYFHLLALSLFSAIAVNVARADGTIDNWVTGNSNILKGGTGQGSTGNVPTAGVIGVFDDNNSGNGGVLGLAVTANGAVSPNGFGTIDLTGVTTGVTTEQMGTYNSSATSNYNVTWMVDGAVFNSAGTGISNINTIIANSSGATLSIQNDAQPSNKYANTGTLTLQLGNASNLIQTSGTGSNISISTVIADGGQASGITYLGSGSDFLTLTGTNTYSGGTTVQSGSVSVGNASGLGTGAVTVSGGTLGTTVQNVSVGGTLTLSSGSIVVNASASPTLKLALNQNFSMFGGSLSLTYNSGNLGSIAGSGTGTFAITGGTLNLNSSLSGAQYNSTYNILTGFSSGSVSGLSFTGYDSTDYTASLSTGGVLSFTAVATPEPNPYLLLLLGFAVIGGARWLRREKSHAVSAL
jgi:autotransporter-associated beta strand protein